MFAQTVGPGLMMGALLAFTGAGGGFVMVPALRRYIDLGMQSIVPTSLAMVVKSLA